MRHLAGHAPDHAGRLVLRHHIAAGGDDRLRAAQAVRAHAGEHQRQHLGAPDRGGRGKQRVDRRLAEIDQRPVVDRDHGDAVAARDLHVLAAGRDIDGAGIDLLAVLRLAHRALGDAGEVLGQDGGEGRRHVLGDQHRRAVEHAADLGDDGVERLRAAGGGADQQHARRRRRHRAQHDRRLDGVMRPGAAAAAAWTVPRQRRAGARTRKPQALRAQAELADFFDQVAAETGRTGDFAIAGRLRDIVGGAERERLQADLGVTPRQRRGHDHDQVALLFEQQRQGGDAVELRHVDVEHHHVGIGALDLVDGLAAGAQRGDHLEVRFGFHPAPKQAAHDHGVVHDHDADASADGAVG